MPRILASVLVLLLSCVGSLPVCAQEVLHFDVKYNYMMVGGEVDGQEGWFFLDTGTPMAFVLNSHYLLVEGVGQQHKARLASGETFLLSDGAAPHQIKLDGMYLPDTKVSIGDLSFIERHDVAPHFLGFLGYGFLQQYCFVIDGHRKTLSLFPAGSRHIVDTERHPLLAVLPFTTDWQRPQVPLLRGTLDGQPIDVVFDTGATSGWIRLTPEMKESMMDSGVLSSGMFDAVTIRSLNIGGVDVDRLKGFRLISGNDNQIMLGYEFFRRYITVWDYSTSTIALFKR